MTTIERYRGDTRPDECTVFDKVTGQPVNIDGCTFLMTLDQKRNPVGDTTRLYQVVGQIVDAAVGRVNFSPTAEQANRVGTVYFDIQMTDPAGVVSTLDLDPYVFTQDITK